MQVTALQIVGLVFTYLIFGGIGYFASKRIKRTIPFFGWVLLIGVVLVVAFVGVDTMLFSVMGFTIYLNWALQAAALGIILGLVLRGRPLVATKS